MQENSNIDVNMGFGNWGDAGKALFRNLGRLSAVLSGYLSWKRANENTDGLFLTNAGRTTGSAAVGLVNGVYSAHPASGGFVLVLNVADYISERAFGVDLGSSDLIVNRVGETTGGLVDLGVFWVYGKPGDVDRALKHHGNYVLKKEGILPGVFGHYGGELLGSYWAELYNIGSGERFRQIRQSAEANYNKVTRALESWLAPLLGTGGY